MYELKPRCGICKYHYRDGRNYLHCRKNLPLILQGKFNCEEYEENSFSQVLGVEMREGFDIVKTN